MTTMFSISRVGNSPDESATLQGDPAESGDQFGFRGDVRVEMEKLLNLFRRHMIGTRANKENSANRAMDCIKGFCSFTRRPIWLWTAEDLPAFIEHKCKTIEGGLSHSSQSGYITYLRTLQNFLMSDLGLRSEIHSKFGVQLQEWVNQGNSVVLKTKKKKRKKLTFALSAEEFARVMAEFDAQIALAFETNSKARFPLARDKVMASVAYSYALRVSELVALRTTNFVPDKRYPQFGNYATIDLIGKGDYEGSTHALDPDIAKVLDWYIKYIRPEFQGSDTTDPELFFYSERGGPLTDEQFRRRLAAIGKSAGIRKKLTPHMLRRTNATDSMDLLGPVGTQKNIRHANVATTYDGYYRPDPNEHGRVMANAIGMVQASRPPRNDEESQ